MAVKSAEPDYDVPPNRPPVEVVARLRELAALHDDWSLRHADASEFNARGPESDYNQHHLDVDGATPEMLDEFYGQALAVMGLDDDEEDEAVRAAVGNADALEAYWTAGKGLKRWRFNRHPWTKLRNLLRKHKSIRDPAGLASTYFHKVFGFWPGARKGDNPVGNEVKRGWEDQDRDPGGENGGRWVVTGTPDELHSDQDRLRRLLAFTDETSGLSVEVGAVHYDGPDENTYVEFTIFNRDGRNVGGGQHSISPPSTRKAELNSIALDEDIQGQGFGVRYLERLKDAYRNHGIQRLDLTANVDVGGYSWARAGFDFADTESRRKLAEYAVEAARRFNPSVQAKIRAVAADPFATPIEFAMVGWEPGAGVWPGKRVMLGSSWRGTMAL